MRPYKIVLSFDKESYQCAWVDLDTIQMMYEPTMMYFEGARFHTDNFVVIRLTQAFRDDINSINYYFGDTKTREEAEEYKERIYKEIFIPLWENWTGKKYG